MFKNIPVHVDFVTGPREKKLIIFPVILNVFQDKPDRNTEKKKKTNCLSRNSNEMFFELIAIVRCKGKGKSK